MDSLTDGEILATRRLSTVRKISLVLTNEFLFCVLWLIHHWNRPVGSKKLSLELRADEQLLKDHLSLLIGTGFVTLHKGKYRITEQGKEGIAFLKQATGKIMSKRGPVTAADDLSWTVCSIPFTVADAEPTDMVVQLPSKTKRDEQTGETKTESSLDTALLISEQEITGNAA